MKKRKSTPFSLAFLDIMFCGFGAVVLLVIILNGQVLEKRQEKHADLKNEFDRVTALHDFAQQQLNGQTDEAAKAERERAAFAAQIDRVREDIRAETASAETTAEPAPGDDGILEAIEQKRAELEELKRDLEQQKNQLLQSGDSVLGYSGDGERQYLTGLKLRGRRTLILIDASASMLDETIVNIVRRKVTSAEERRSAPKWQRAVRSAHWLLANLQSGKHFQVYAFNEEAQALVSGTDGQWLKTGDADNRQGALSAIRKLVPEKGTNLQGALAVARRLSPAPDSIVLLTDGLPTLATLRATGTKISGEERMRLFEAAVRRLPDGVPVSTLLFPIEGDPTAAEAFWRLAIATQGSFITPSRDWP